MKALLLLLFLSFGCLIFGQKEESKPSEQKVSSYVPAQYPGGADAFGKEFLFMVHSYLDMKQYAANGKFTFVFTIDEKGKITGTEIVPKVKNSQLFIEDMQFAASKIRKRFSPATRDGIPVASVYVAKITFYSDHIDEEF